MNEWILVGVVVVGTILAVGGGGMIWSAISRKTNTPPKA